VVQSDEVGRVSNATGLGLLDVAILEGCHRVGAVSDAPYVNTSLVLDEVHGQMGVGPRIAYEPLCNMARPWVVHLALVDFHGNYGDIDSRPAAARYTECRLTPLGVAALAAERDTAGRLPIGLINGDTWVGGMRPPLDPSSVIAAIKAASTATDDELAEMVGQPSFPSGCDVEVDLEAFSSGAETELQLSARISSSAVDRLVVSHLPPDCSPSEIAESIRSRNERDRRDKIRGSQRGPADGRMDDRALIRNIGDISDSADGTRLEISVVRGSDLEEARRYLNTIWHIRRTMSVRLTEPVAALIRPFGSADSIDVDQRMAAIGAAIRTN